MKHYMDIPAINKEDLIGSYKNCPWCKKRLVIKEEGVNHTGNKHIVCDDLDGVYVQYLMNKEWQKYEFKLFFGE